jgi:hypothetical protein
MNTSEREVAHTTRERSREGPELGKIASLAARDEVDERARRAVDAAGSVERVEGLLGAVDLPDRRVGLVGAGAVRSGHHRARTIRVGTR